MLSRRQRLRGSVSRQISRDGRNFSIMRWPFARKSIRPFGSVTAEDIQKEVKAITDICASGGHKNVIRFIDHGPLRASDYYYIDMEFASAIWTDISTLRAARCFGSIRTWYRRTPRSGSPFGSIVRMSGLSWVTSPPGSNSCTTEAMRIEI